MTRVRIMNMALEHSSRNGLKSYRGREAPQPHPSTSQSPCTAQGRESAPRRGVEDLEVNLESG